MQDYALTKCDTDASNLDLGKDCPLVFSSVEEAKAIFEVGRRYLTGVLEQPTRALPGSMIGADPIHENMSSCRTVISNLWHSLAIFAGSRASQLTPQEDIALTALQVHVMNANVIVHAKDEPPPPPQGPDEEIARIMRDMVRLCEKLISSLPLNQDYSSSTSQHAPSFCLDLGFIIPLYTVASQCPDTALRRTAIALLRSTPRQEGLWNSEVVAKAAERILEIEERHGAPLAPFVGNQTVTFQRMLARLLNPGMVLQLDGMGARLQYLHPGVGMGPAVGVVEELCQW